jgi:hypothetical protein
LSPGRLERDDQRKQLHWSDRGHIQWNRRHLRFNSSSQITATVLAGATAGLVEVKTPGGTGTSESNFVVTP